MKDFIQISKPSLLFLCQRQSKKCNDWIFQILRNARTLIFNNFTLGSQTREKWNHRNRTWMISLNLFGFCREICIHFDITLINTHHISSILKMLRVLFRVLAKEHVVFIKSCPSLKIPWWENVQSKQFAVSQIRVQSVARLGCNAGYSSHCTLYCAVQGGGGSSNDWSLGMQNSRIPDPSYWLRDRHTDGSWSGQFTSLSVSAQCSSYENELMSLHHINISETVSWGHNSVFLIPRMLTRLLSEHASGSTPRNWCRMHAASDAGRAYLCCLSDLDGGVVSQAGAGPMSCSGPVQLRLSSGSMNGARGPVSAVSDDCKHWTLNKPKLKVDTDTGHANKTNQPVIKTWH